MSQQNVKTVLTNTANFANISTLREERNKRQNAFVEALDRIEIWDYDLDGKPINFSGKSFFDKMNSAAGVGGSANDGILKIRLPKKDGTGFDDIEVSNDMHNKFNVVYSKCKAHLDLTPEDIETMHQMTRMYLFDSDRDAAIGVSFATVIGLAIGVSSAKSEAYEFQEGQYNGGAKIGTLDYVGQIATAQNALDAVQKAPDAEKSFAIQTSQRNALSASIAKMFDSIDMSATGWEMGSTKFSNNGHTYSGFEAFLYDNTTGRNHNKRVVKNGVDNDLDEKDRARYVATYNKLKNGEDLTQQDFQNLDEMRTITVNCYGTVYHPMDGSCISGMNIRDGGYIQQLKTAQQEVDTLTLKPLSPEQMKSQLTPQHLEQMKLQLYTEADALVRGFDGIRAGGSESTWVNNGHVYMGFEAFLYNPVTRKEVGGKELTEADKAKYVAVYNKLKNHDFPLSSTDIDTLKLMRYTYVVDSRGVQLHVMDGGYNGGMNIRDDKYIDDLLKHQTNYESGKVIKPLPPKEAGIEDRNAKALVMARALNDVRLQDVLTGYFVYNGQDVVGKNGKILAKQGQTYYGLEAFLIQDGGGKLEVNKDGGVATVSPDDKLRYLAVYDKLRSGEDLTATDFTTLKELTTLTAIKGGVTYKMFDGGYNGGMFLTDGPWFAALQAAQTTLDKNKDIPKVETPKVAELEAKPEVGLPEEIAKLEVKPEVVQEKKSDNINTQLTTGYSLLNCDTIVMEAKNLESRKDDIAKQLRGLISVVSDKTASVDAKKDAQKTFEKLEIDLAIIQKQEEKLKTVIFTAQNTMPLTDAQRSALNAIIEPDTNSGGVLNKITGIFKDIFTMITTSFKTNGDQIRTLQDMEGMLNKIEQQNNKVNIKMTNTNNIMSSSVTSQVSSHGSVGL